VSEQEFQMPNNAWRLDGQVALFTGTTSGLGKRFARVLAAAGAPSASSSSQRRSEPKGASALLFPHQEWKRKMLAGEIELEDVDTKAFTAHAGARPTLAPDGTRTPPEPTPS
jgi:NAD(P)-dependent dehydrogenase (short-subunit alcohol dehydrogenase family)